MATHRFPFRLVSFDIDGTLVRGHGWEAIARAGGREAEYRATNARFRAGGEDEDEHLHRLLDLAVGATVPEVEGLVARTPKVGGIPETLAELKQDGVRVAILSHNPEYVVEWYRRTYSFDDAEGTPGTILDGDRIVAAGPAHADKVGGMRRLLVRAGLDPSEAAHIGDGTADLEVFRRIGGGVAFNSTVRSVEEEADAVVRSPDLTAVVPALASLRPRAV